MTADLSQEAADQATDQTATAETAAAESYWTPAKVVLGLFMAVAAAGIVGFIQWDEVVRIANGASGTRPALVNAASREPDFDLTDLRLPKDRILSGGPRKDGIPSLTDPAVAPVLEADFMNDDDRVVGITIDGQSRAYPIKVLNYHECYNDVIADVPIAVIFCPLCDSVSVVDRRLDGKTYEFGISGLLFNSNVLLHDRQDDALWSQVGFEAVSGPNAGRSLRHLAGWELTTFAKWSDEHPDSTVATIDTGHYRGYDDTPYTRYFENDDVMFPVEPTDDRFLNKTPVVGVFVGGVAKAYPVDSIVAAADGRVEDTLAGQRIILQAQGTPATVRVVETPEGSQAVHTFWFAWYAFHPDTKVYGR